MGKKIAKISSYAIDLLNKYDFPGNIRELENLIERSVALSSTNILLPDSLAISFHKKKWLNKDNINSRFELNKIQDGISLDDILIEIERAYIEKALEYSGGKKQKAADLLGISFRSMRHRINKLGIEKEH